MWTILVNKTIYRILQRKFHFFKMLQYRKYKPNRNASNLAWEHDMMMLAMQKSTCNASYSDMHRYIMQILSVIIKPVHPTDHPINIEFPTPMIYHDIYLRAIMTIVILMCYVTSVGGWKIRWPYMEDHGWRRKGGIQLAPLDPLFQTKDGNIHNQAHEPLRKGYLRHIILIMVHFNDVMLHGCLKVVTGRKRRRLARRIMVNELLSQWSCSGQGKDSSWLMIIWKGMRNAKKNHQILLENRTIKSKGQLKQFDFP